MMLNQERQVPKRDQAGHQSHHQKEVQSESSCDSEVKSGRAARRAEIYGERKSC